MSGFPVDVNPVQTAAEAAAQLNRTEGLVRAAQMLRKNRGEAYVRAAALYKREFRKARIRAQDAPSDKVRDDLADNSPLTHEVQIEAQTVAMSAGLVGIDFDVVADLELLTDLCKESRDGARDAARAWERVGSQWQSVVGWSRDDAAREMGGRR